MSTILGSIGRYFDSDTIQPFFNSVDRQAALLGTFDWKTALITYLVDKPQFSSSQKDEITRINPRKFLDLYLEMNPHPINPNNIAPHVNVQRRARFIRK